MCGIIAVVVMCAIKRDSLHFVSFLFIVYFVSFLFITCAIKRDSLYFVSFLFKVKRVSLSHFSLSKRDSLCRTHDDDCDNIAHMT